MRIDLLTAIDGVSFAEAFAHHIEAPVDGRLVPFIGRDELIANKQATGRLQDLADVERLRSADGP